MPGVISFDYLGHMAKYNRMISDVEEFHTRLAAFTANHNWIVEHNDSGASWEAGHNQFSDWSHTEYKAILGFVEDDSVAREVTVFAETNEDSVDWVTSGGVTPVKD